MKMNKVHEYDMFRINSCSLFYNCSSQLSSSATVRRLQEVKITLCTSNKLRILLALLMTFYYTVCAGFFYTKWKREKNLLRIGLHFFLPVIPWHGKCTQPALLVKMHKRLAQTLGSAAHHRVLIRWTAFCQRVRRDLPNKAAISDQEGWIARSHVSMRVTHEFRHGRLTTGSIGSPWWLLCRE